MKKFSFNRRLSKLLFLVAGVALIVGLGGSSYRLWKKRDIVRERQAVLQALEAENQALQKQLQDAQSDGFVERMAREKLGLVKEGETMVIVDKPSVISSQPSAGTEESVPNWKKWWALFF